MEINNESRFRLTNSGTCIYEASESLEGKVEIPQGITEIHDNAFLGNGKITEVVLPETLAHIGKGAFSRCTALKRINIPKSVRAIGSDAFTGCKSLESIELPDEVGHIGNCAFSGCERLAWATLPSTLEHISEGMFFGCSSLHRITIPDTVKSIGDLAFGYCTELNSIAIPQQVRSIGVSAFRCCTSLTNVDMGDNVESIGYSAFESCGKSGAVTGKPTTPVKAYKGFLLDGGKLLCRELGYDEGGAYEIGQGVPCKDGFLAYINPLDVFTYYAGAINDTLEIHEVWLDDIQDCGDTGLCESSSVAGRKMTVGRKLSLSEISKIFNDLKGNPPKKILKL